ncbi:MAG: biotin--[acetyl-CoA-carboxylase] ligase, partial [Candidatus Margulisbacteria bacterium]|nr:biotin--[acetyl-CoA-carboxylase] ligase [Candidatus Margulisiibacteriota bacterium]
YKSPADTSIFTLLASQAVINTIKKVSGRKASIKAPNDVLLEGKKICGILIERITCSGTPVLIVGIGINLNMNEFSPDLESTATSLSLECERSFDKKIFMDTLLDELDHEYSKFLANRI